MTNLFFVVLSLFQDNIENAMKDPDAIQPCQPLICNVCISFFIVMYLNDFLNVYFSLCDNRMKDTEMLLIELEVLFQS